MSGGGGAGGGGSTFGASDIGALLGTSADGALPTTADSRGAGASALAQLGVGGGRSAGPTAGGIAGKGGAAGEDVSQLTAAQAAELVRSRHATGKRDVGRTVKRHRADRGDEDEDGGSNGGIGGAMYGNDDEEEGVFNIGGGLGAGSRCKKRRKKKALQYKMLADQGILKPEEAEGAKDTASGTAAVDSFAVPAGSAPSPALASKPGGYPHGDDHQEEEEDDAFVMTNASAAAARSPRKKAEAIVLSRRDRQPTKSRRRHGSDSDSDSSAGSHHLPPPRHRRGRTMGAGAANGHLDDKDDRVLLRDPAHRHRMTMVEFRLGGEGRERRRPKEEERRTRSFRLAGPQKPPMNKTIRWQHRWM